MSEEKRIDSLEKTVYGNGRAGLVEEMATVKTMVSVIKEDVGGLRTSYSALVKSQIEHDAVEKLKCETRQKNMKYATLMVAIMGLSITIASFAIS